MVRREKTVYFIDGSAQLHRAYFAIRNLSTTRGLPTGATYGFTTMLRKLYQDEDPEWCGISFDLAGPTFRHQEYTEYKAQRRRMEDDLAVQLPYVRRVCGVPGIGEKGARDLVREFGPLEAVLENVDRIKKATYREGLRAHAPDAVLSKRLVTLRADVPVTLDLTALRRPPADRAAAHGLFT